MRGEYEGELKAIERIFSEDTAIGPIVSDRSAEAALEDLHHSLRSGGTEFRASVSGLESGAQSLLFTFGITP